jgi:hypothetical protein
LEVTASIVHGSGLYIFVADEDMVVGSDWICEVTMRSLDLAFRRFQERNQAWPDHLICQADNTCREAKNGIFSKLLMSLVSAKLFTACTMQFLQVGHTHEDVDAVFGLLSRALREAPEALQTPQQVCQLLQATLEPVFARRGEEVKVMYVTACRPWGQMLPREVKLAGAFMTREVAGERVEAPHSFTFLTRRSLASHVQMEVEDSRKGAHAQASDLDVVVLVKQLMSDEALSQPPLVVFPASFERSASDVFAQMNVVAGIAPLSFALQFQAIQ